MKYIINRREAWNKQARKGSVHGDAAAVVATNDMWKSLDAEADLDNFLRHNPEAGSLNALEFGCGVGRVVAAATKRFTHVTGVDISPTVLAGAQKYLQKQGIDQSKYTLTQLGDDCQIDAPTDSIGFAYSIICLQHNRCADARRKIYNELSRVLSPGAMACFQYSYADPKIGIFSDVGGGPSGSPDWAFRDPTEFPLEFQQTSFQIVSSDFVDHVHGKWVFLTLRNTK